MSPELQRPPASALLRTEICVVIAIQELIPSHIRNGGICDFSKLLGSKNCFMLHSLL